MKKIGSWDEYKKLKHLPKIFDKAITCEGCEQTFRVTLETNIEKEEALIFLGDDYKIEDKFWSLFPKEYARNNYEQVTKYNSLCPNCGEIEDLFCISHTPEIKERTEWRRVRTIDY
ncbi:hypothetical protein M0R19_02870 [Candidatus Pacearchaeota archaeon]|nr:hypothetical protein [Candidatus Pacearchaeota archaeon]